MNEPFFDTLRTKEQLGYSVTSSRWSRTASLGLRLRVQSERHPDFLEARVDAFLEHYKGILEEMSEDTFVEYRDGVAKKKREKLNNMKDEQDRFWAHINSGYFDFERGALLTSHREYMLIPSSRTRCHRHRDYHARRCEERLHAFHPPLVSNKDQALHPISLASYSS